MAIRRADAHAGKFSFLLMILLILLRIFEYFFLLLLLFFSRLLHQLIMLSPEKLASASSTTAVASDVAASMAAFLRPTQNVVETIRTVVMQQQSLNQEIEALNQKMGTMAMLPTTQQQQQLDSYVQKLRLSKQRVEALGKMLIAIKARLWKVHTTLQNKTRSLERENEEMTATVTSKTDGDPAVAQTPQCLTEDAKEDDVLPPAAANAPTTVFEEPPQVSGVEKLTVGNEGTAQSESTAATAALEDADGPTTDGGESTTTKYTEQAAENDKQEDTSETAAAPVENTSAVATKADDDSRSEAALPSAPENETKPPPECEMQVPEEEAAAAASAAVEISEGAAEDVAVSQKPSGKKPGGKGKGKKK